LSDCIVIGFVNYGESDRIVKLFTSEKGLISAIAKRVRSHKHKWAGLLEVGQVLEAKLSPPKNDLWLIQGLQEVSNTSSLRKDLFKLSTMQYCCEVTGTLSISEDPNPKLHGLLIYTLQTLKELPAPGSAVLNGFAVKALAISGHPPQLRSCTLCGNDIGNSRHFHPNLGSMIHESCLEQHPDAQSPHIFHTPKAWAGEIFNLLHQPMISYWENNLTVVKNGKRSSTWLLTEMIEHTVERGIRSRSMLQTLFP
jgi:DNA repair protein RecO (recombination protein O)